ncbi:MAG TPA: CPBP family glutamic-type intramembrane protease [Tepidisphaeraceae bacterium]|nr:CPBP family glutamic-type intramembrane protease [Tepidisphaeraceae bacterium]
MSRAAAPRAGAPAAPAERSPSRELPPGYLRQSELPLACLVFLLPFIVLYELGTRQYAFDAVHHTEQRIIAFNLMLRFFHWFGATGRYMPPLAVVGILLACHIARNDPWRVRGSTLVGMAFEGLAWGLPLLAIGTLIARYVAQYLPLMTGEGNWRTLAVLSLGAGIYEELVFRLVALTLLHLLLRDLLRIPKFWSYLAMVAISSLGFALYHYLGAEDFSWRSLAFRTVAGVYFAGLFLLRGFGVTAFAHSAYDIYVIYLRYAAQA